MRCLRVRSNTALLPLALAALAALTSCGDDDDDRDAGPSPGRDATPANPDAAGNDAEAADGGTADAARSDGGRDGGSSDAGAGARSIIFLHTNDEHSHQIGFAPEIDDWPTPATPGSGIVGGIKRRAKVIEQLRGEAAVTPLRSPVALVSAGDMMIGSMFHVANAIAGIDFALAKILLYDVITLGNHEFELGVDALANALATGGIDLAGNPGVVQIPIVTSNIRFSMSSTDDDRLAAFYGGGRDQPLRRTYVKNFGNVKVGFLGLMGLEAALFAVFKTPARFSLATNQTACTRDADCPGSVCLAPASDPKASSGRCAVNDSESDAMTHFPALIADAASAVAELRAQNVDLVVAVSHAGVDERELNMLSAMGMGPENARASEEILIALGVDQALAGMKGIDVIIGGHSHTALRQPLLIRNPRSGLETVIVQAGEYGKHVGKLRLVQPTATSTWSVDRAYTGLVDITDQIVPTGFDPFTEIALDMILDRVIEALESTGVAQPGDGMVMTGEECDTPGPRLPNSGNCVGLVAGATGGRLACHPNRQLDISGCTFSRVTVCGNGVKEGDEACDMNDIGATCQSAGHLSGSLSCASNCTLDVSMCSPNFPSLLEVALSFGQPAPIVDDEQQVGDLFFYRVGTTSFDVPTKTPFNESNLMNLVTDAERAVPNQLIFTTDPIRISFNANGVLRDGIAEGRTGQLSAEDLFRVLPLGVSPLDRTPGFPLVDFVFFPQEIKAGLEVGLSRGTTADSFWIGLSGARVEYSLNPARPPFDPTNPLTGMVTKVTLTTTTAAPTDDSLAALEATPIFDETRVGAPFSARPIHVATSLYVALLMEGLGLCPREKTPPYDQAVECRTCSSNTDCTAQGSTCDTSAGRCSGGRPAALRFRTLATDHDTILELKEFLALMTYLRGAGTMPAAYEGPVPRRMCCVDGCPADMSRTCR